MSQQFNEVRVGTSSRSTFDLSHHQVMTTDFGYLTPICVRDMVPNDHFVVKPSVFCRLAPLAFPAYGRITARIHSFYVPYRILYPHWSEYITQSSSNNTIPPYFVFRDLATKLSHDKQFNPTGGDKYRGIYGRLMANLGLNPEIVFSPHNASGHSLFNERISAFRFLAYYRIWLDWFMDSSISDHSNYVANFNNWIKDGGDLYSTLDSMLLTRSVCFKKDYFTTAKLNPQAGSSPSIVGVDIASPSLNPGLNPNVVASASSSGQNGLRYSDGGKVYNNKATSQGPDSTANSYIGQFTVEELRAATSLQRYLERNNYVGTKVINQLLVHFGIAPTPERLDMSEFIGGSNFPIQIGDVTSTTPSHSTEDLATIGLGAQAGKGIGAAQSETIEYHAKEHGVFMTLMSILPDTAYYQGIPKEFSLGVHGDPLDYYTPEFENLGYEPILNKEVYVPTDDDYSEYDPDGIFGYSPRYAYLKFQRSILAGDFLGSAVGSSVMGNQMDSWHLFRKLKYDNDNPLALNQNFVQCQNVHEGYDRIFQITDNKLDHFYCNIDVDVKATRDMVGFSEPSLESVNKEDGDKINLPYGGTRL